MQKYELILNYKIFPENIFYNIEFSNKKGTPQPKGIDNKRSRTILQYTLDGKFIKEWHGSKEIARAFNGCNSFILKCCRGIYHQAYGYIWKFKEGD